MGKGTKKRSAPKPAPKKSGAKGAGINKARTNNTAPAKNYKGLTSYKNSFNNPYGDMFKQGRGGTVKKTGSNPKGSGGRPAAAKKPSTNWKAKYDSANSRIAGLNKSYAGINKKYQTRMAEDAADPNRNLKAATIKGNESNTRSITSFNSMAENLTNKLNQRSGQFTQDNIGQLNNMYDKFASDSQNQVDSTIGRLQGSTDKYNTDISAATQNANDRTQGRTDKYTNELQQYKDNMGKADQDIHTRNRGQAYAGLDSGFSEANDQLQADLARRGLSGAGIGAKAMTDLAQDRMRAGATAGVNAYTSAIDMSDNRRGQRAGLAGTQYGADMGNITDSYGRTMGQLGAGYGADQNNINSQHSLASGQINSLYNSGQANVNNAYQKNMAMLGQNYGNTMAVRGQALQNTLNNNQQRIGNLMGYSQLGRGMAGMSQNYLQQAGTGYTNIGGQAGQTAIGIGGLNNSYNATMQNAQAKKNAKGSDVMGTALGVGGSLMFSDERLKSKIQKVGEVSGHNVYTWKWNSKAKEIGIKSPEFGVIAQEILVTNPEAIHKDHVTGYLYVNYNKLFGGTV